MAVNYAEKYSPNVDERFKLGSLTAGIVNNDYDWIGVSTVKVYSIPTVAMNNYSLTGQSRYGTPTELGNEEQEMTITQDRSFTFTIDRKSYDDTMMTMEAGRALRRQIDEVVIPEVDSYVYNVMATGAGTKPAAVTLTETNIYSEILKATEALDDAEAPESGRVLVVSPSVYLLMKRSQDITMETEIGNDMRLKGVISNVDGAAVVRIPSARLPEDFGFMLCHPCACVAPTKLEDYKIHVDPPGISGSLVEGRIVYDAFVLDNKKMAIYYQSNKATE